MNDDFRPTHYDEETDTETTYLPGFPYVMRDQGLYAADELAVCVLGDIADCAEDAKLPCANKAGATYRKARNALEAYSDGDGDGTYPEWISDASFNPPEGISVDWDGDAGTVTTTVTAGWPQDPGSSVHDCGTSDDCFC